MKRFIILGMLYLAYLFGVSSVFAEEITVSIEAGEHWKEKREPQIAVWAEDLDGNFLRTLYVTKRASKKNWICGPKEGRPESLPVWYHAAKYNPAKLKDKADEDFVFDSVTGATPKGGIFFTAEITDLPCIIKAEFNTSFDYNDFYTKKNSGVNGQPSVVYKAQVKEKSKDKIVLEFLGTGSIDGANGKICSDTEGLTSAKNIVKNITVSF